MSTINGKTVTQTVTLGSTSGYPTYASPLTMTATGAINVGAGDGVYAGFSFPSATLVNQGTIIAGSDGVDLKDPGAYVDNSGLIQGSKGVYVLSGVVTNSGTIVGTSGIGLNIQSGGSVSNTAGLIEGTVGVQFSGSANVINSGSILGTSSFGVLLPGGQIMNMATGTIRGSQYGIYATGFATVSNAGTIAGTNLSGIKFLAGGSVDNSGLIQCGLASIPSYGVYFRAGANTVTNTGTITGFSGIRSISNAYVTNSSTGVIAGGRFGIVIESSGTIIDAGTITGHGGGFAAVVFGGNDSHLLALQPGYKIVGGIQGDGPNNTLELLGSAGNPLTVNYSSLGLMAFQDILFGAGGNATLKVASTTGTLPVTISGLGLVSDTVDLTSIGTNGTISAQSATSITVTGSLGSVTLMLDASDNPFFSTASDGAGGTDLVACYCRGTMILTPFGEMPVEELEIGDPVMTLSGRARPVRWIGRRAYDGRFVAGNRLALPICVKKGALGDGVPRRDLWVSPGHSLYIDGALARSEHLLNGVTIVQAEQVDAVEYFHIEFDSHDVIFADGAPAESFVDCDNRAKFSNAAEYAALYPEDDRPNWTFCAPCLPWGSLELNAIRAALLERAAQSGHALDRDPDLHLVVDGEVVRGKAVSPQHYRFTVPAGRDLRLVSRTSVPATVDPDHRDLRTLGVAIEHLVLSDGALRIEMAHGHTGLGEGFHDDEETLRWTNGSARLPDALLRPFADGCTLDIHLVDTELRYWLPGAAAAA